MRPIRSVVQLALVRNPAAFRDRVRAAGNEWAHRFLASTRPLHDQALNGRRAPEPDGDRQFRLRQVARAGSHDACDVLATNARLEPGPDPVAICARSTERDPY